MDNAAIQARVSVGGPVAAMFEKLKSTMSRADSAKLKNAAMEFEAVLVTQMLQVMRQSIPKDGLIEQDSGIDTYHQMFDIEIGRQVAKEGGLGLAKMLEAQLRQRIENSIDFAATAAGVPMGKSEKR